MDDDFSNLEAELKRLRPTAPLPTLAARIDRELSAPAPAAVLSVRTTRAWWLWAGALPAAAAVLAVLVFTQATRPTVLPAAVPNTVATTPASAPVLEPEVFKPVAAENVLYAVADEGVVTLADGTAARRERLNYVDTITWRNPRTNASVRWTVPREEVRIVPVKFQ